MSALLAEGVGETDIAFDHIARDFTLHLSGTPFKARFLTNGAVPFGAKAFVVLYFAAFFGVFAATLAYFAVPFVKGVFSLHPVAWTVGCFGGSGVLVQIADRLPSWLGHSHGLEKSAEGVTSA